MIVALLLREPSRKYLCIGFSLCTPFWEGNKCLETICYLAFLLKDITCIISPDYIIINVYPCECVFSSDFFVVELVLMKEIALYL